MKNMKIRMRMLLSYFLILVISSIASIAGLVMLNQTGGNLNTFYDNNYTITVNAWTARRCMQAARADILSGIQQPDKASTSQDIQAAEKELETMQATFPVIRAIFKGDMALVDKVESLAAEAADYRERVTELALALRNEEAFDIMEDQYAPILDEMAATLDQITNTVGEKAQGMVDDSNRAVKTSIILVAVLLGGSVLAAVFLGIFISNSIRKPVNEIEQAAEAMANGDLSATIAYESRDELGHLSESMRTTMRNIKTVIEDAGRILAEMAAGNFNINTRAEEHYVGEFQILLKSMRKLNRDLDSTLGQIDMSADQVNAGSEQVSTGSQALAQGAAEQASSVEELAATINDISGQVQENAENAVQASKMATETGDQIMTCNQQMQDMIAAMGEIDSTSQEISKIISTIENIAFQTNILALNAAVEAARAGAAGKGFAVVADEVRSLANKSQEASKDTAALIERAIQAVRNGTKIADETGKALLVVVEGAKEITASIEQISRASETQAASIQQVTQGVDQISSVVQTNSATAEESAAASEELSGQAQILKGLVGQFKLRKDGQPEQRSAAEAGDSTSGADSGFSTEFAGSGKY